MLNRLSTSRAPDDSLQSRSVRRRITAARAILLVLLLLLVCKAVWLVRMEPRRQALGRLEECGCRPIAPHGVDVDELTSLERASFSVNDGSSRQRLRFLRYLLPVSAINCGYSRPDDAALAELIHFPELQILYVQNGAYTDRGMRHVGRMRNLEILCVRDTPITDAGLRHLADLDRLRVLDLSMTWIEGEVFKELSCRETLEELDVWMAMPLSDEGLMQLRHFQNLRKANLIAGDPVLMEGHGFAVLSELPNLEQVGVPEYFREQWEPHVSHIPKVYTE